MPKTLPMSSWCTSERLACSKCCFIQPLRAASPQGGAGIAVTSSCKSSSWRSCERNQANASCTRRNSAIAATCCWAEREDCDSLNDNGSPENARTGGPKPMRMPNTNTEAEEDERKARPMRDKTACCRTFKSPSSFLGYNVAQERIYACQ